MGDPRAPRLVGQLAARAVGDGVLCNTHADRHKGTVDWGQASAALGKATVLPSVSEGGKCTESVSGSGVGRYVNSFVREIDMLLKECLLSGDVSEAEYCLQGTGSTSFSP